MSHTWKFLLLSAVAAAISLGQGLSLANGGSVIGPQDLIPPLAASLQAMGARMLTPTQAEVALSGTIVDSAGSRSAQVIVQAPAYFAYREGQNRAITFNGSQFRTKSGSLTTADEAIAESLLANFPDAVYLQIAAGGSLRRTGSHFRTDNSVSKNYTGPYWTVFAFAPKVRPGLTPGSALQQPLFVAIDEHTGLIADVRVAVKTAPGQEKTIQTQFSNWSQVAGQWFPGTIVRLENGVQTLSFQTQAASVGPALAATAFQP